MFCYILEREQGRRKWNVSEYGANLQVPMRSGGALQPYHRQRSPDNRRQNRR